MIKFHLIMMTCPGYTWLMFAGVIFNVIPGHLSQTATYANETALRASLQSGYDRFSRPYSPTVVNFSYGIRTLVALDITAQTMDHLGLFIMSWTDPRISWDPAAYNNLTYLYVNWAWRPEISVSNGGNIEFGLDDDDTRLTVFSDGSVKWTPVMSGQTTCDVSVANFPFDKQTCDVRVGFWGMEAFDGATINISSSTMDTSFYLLNGEWDLESSTVSTETFYSCCPEVNLIFVNMKVRFARLHPFFVINVIIPVILLSICMSWSFYLPSESGERIGYCLTILLSYTLFLTITAEMVPTTSTELPHLGVYLLLVLIICTIAVCNVAFHVKLFFLEDTPSLACQATYRKLYPFVFFTACCKKRTKTVVQAVARPETAKDVSLIMEGADCKTPGPADDMDNGAEVQDEAPPVTWPMISILLDRIFFCIYNIAIFILNLGLVFTLTVNYANS